MEAMRKLAMVAALAAATGAMALAVGAAGHGNSAKPPRIARCDVFPDFQGGRHAASSRTEAAWNQNVSHAPVARHSKRYLHTIRGLGGNQAIHPDFGRKYGIPYDVVGPNQRKVKVKVSPYGYESDFGRAPIPPNARVEKSSDRHVVVLQRKTCRLFEMYAAEYLGGHGHRWHAGSTARFNLGSTKLRPAFWTSADAAGLPILPGLVRYGEVAHGHVRHAIRATFEATRAAYIKPATHFASPYCKRGLPPMGLRLRLKRSYYRKNLHRFPKGSQSRPIFAALYRYGIINADNGGTDASWFIGGATSKHWHNDDLQRLTSVPGKAFVVVKSAAKPRVSSAC